MTKLVFSALIILVLTAVVYVILDPTTQPSVEIPLVGNAAEPGTQQPQAASPMANSQVVRKSMSKVSRVETNELRQNGFAPGAIAPPSNTLIEAGIAGEISRIKPPEDAKNLPSLQPTSQQSESLRPARRTLPALRTPPDGSGAFHSPVRDSFSGQQTDVILDLAPGVREPIAMVTAENPVNDLPEQGDELTSEQSNAILEISEDFKNRIHQAASTLPEEELSETWDAEQEHADSLYRILFGDSAYNQKSAERALDARRE